MAGEINVEALVGRAESDKTLVRFEDATDKLVPRLRYSIPLPGSYEGCFFMEMESGGLPWADAALEAAEEPMGLYAFSVGTVSSILAGATAPSAVHVRAPAAPDAIPSSAHVRAPAAPTVVAGPEGQANLRFHDHEIPVREIWLEATQNRALVIYRSFGDIVQHTYVPVSSTKDTANPRFVIVEHYRLSSHFGDYGAGRTVKTFSLWPGEETTLYVRSWRRTEQRFKEASTIFDSYTTEAATDFQSSLDNENTDRTAQKKTSQWKAEGGLGLNLGIFKIGGGGGGGGTSESAHETLAKTVSKVATHHASKASAKRDTTISTEVETSEAAEFETITERHVKNVNQSRVLNLVCRELNQEFRTYLALIDVTIAFANDRMIYEEVPLCDVDRLLNKYLRDTWGGAPPAGADPNPRRHVKDLLWQQLNRVKDFQGNLKPFIEEVQDPLGGTYWRVRHRFDPDAAHPFYPEGNVPVEGIVLDLSVHTVRTDGIIIDALLGHGVALDNYALGTQQEVLREKQLNNARTEMALNLIELGDADKIKAFQALFPCCEKQVLQEILGCLKGGGE